MLNIFKSERSCCNRLLPIFLQYCLHQLIGFNYLIVVFINISTDEILLLNAFLQAALYPNQIDSVLIWNMINYRIPTVMIIIN